MDKSYTEQLKERIEEAAGTVLKAVGRALDPMMILTIFQAITSFFSSCRQPTPTPPPASSRGKHPGFAGPDDGPVMVGLKHHLKVSCKEQYGRGWRDTWRAEEEHMTTIAKKVANGATKEEIDGLRKELKAHAM